MAGATVHQSRKARRAAEIEAQAFDGALADDVVIEEIESLAPNEWVVIRYGQRTPALMHYAVLGCSAPQWGAKTPDAEEWVYFWHQNQAREHLSRWLDKNWW